MDDIRDFVHTRNVERFLRILEHDDLDPTRRTTIQSLLQEELARLGEDHEAVQNCAADYFASN